MSFAALNERAEIRYKHRPCDMTVNIVTYLASLPEQQVPPPVGNLSRSGCIDLLLQQQSSFKQCALGRMYLVVKLTNGCLKKKNDPEHPFARFCRTQVRYRQGLI